MMSSSLHQPSASKRTAMSLDEHSDVTQVRSRPRITARARRIQERMKGHAADPHVEPPTLAYSIVYFTTIALLCALCAEAAFR